MLVMECLDTMILPQEEVTPSALVQCEFSNDKESTTADDELDEEDSETEADYEGENIKLNYHFLDSASPDKVNIIIIIITWFRA